MPCLALFVVLTHTAPDLSDSQILRFVCGIRPCRTGGLRLETERVAGKHVTVKVDGKVTADYVEPDGVKREQGFEGRVIGRGTFALQCHDPGSEVRFKDIAVRPLPEATKE